ncbi:MAG: ribosome recycling factor, partial [Chloroflexi bacterium]|nr:ribosome recycling factor [Chloroflexota bacterium]
MTTEQLEIARNKMKSAVDILHKDLAGVRTGRANPGLVENLTVDYHGTHLPIKQLGTISAPDARSLMIQPWDASAVAAVEKAIRNSDLSIMPNVDGRVIRLTIPPLTEERRRDIVKMVRKRVEEAR